MNPRPRQLITKAAGIRELRLKRAPRIQSSAPPFEPDGWINAAALNSREKRSREEDGSRKDERTREEVDGGGVFVAAGDRRVEDKERLPPI